MQAIPGPRPTLIREVQSLVLGDGGFGEDLQWGHDRGRDFACVATIIHLIDIHPTLSFPTAARLEKWLSSTIPVPAKMREAVLETFQIFVALVKDKKYNSAFGGPARVSPIEFTMIGVLIHRLRKTHSLKQLFSAICLLRADVRKKHVDIRSNQKVANTMFNFLNEELDDIKVVGDGKRDMSASIAIKPYMNRSLSSTVRPQSPHSPSGEKRRRQQQTASSDSEAEAVPRKRPSLPGTLSSAKTIVSTRAKATNSKKNKSTAGAAASTSKAAGKTPAGSTKTASASKKTTGHAHAAASKSSAAAVTTVKVNSGRLTTRTTRTSAIAAADSLALAQISASSTMSLLTSAPQSLLDEPIAKQERAGSDRMDEDPETATLPGEQVSITPAANKHGLVAQNSGPALQPNNAQVWRLLGHTALLMLSANMPSSGHDSRQRGSKFYYPIQINSH
ncbi:hypothetical protein BN946_scf184950.g3 [Trametes cinnabarina]|uniref:Uncharacterized protein n=1 Tax=Pycnoporus cinnabarinus TaxID=5643 RepID=A0A060SPU8_PYCCI|nr:hypothetical protein BN946_scf184950.g3 [Trametes cinnabarina]